jgi:DNA-binding transcriptional MerR regulator
MDLQGRLLHSGELAVLAGVSTDTLRHYERKGLLPAAPRSANGYRQYPGDTLDRIRLIRSGLRMGFTIDELARVLRVRASGGVPCKEVRSMALKKVSDLREREKELRQMVRMLERVIRDWDRRLRDSNGRPAHLLQSLAAGQSGGRLAPPFSSSRRRIPKQGEGLEKTVVYDRDVSGGDGVRGTNSGRRSSTARSNDRTAR